MDSVMEDDPTLPLDLEKSTNMAKFREAIAARGLGPEIFDYSTAGMEDHSDLSSLPAGSQVKASGQNGPISPQTKTMKDYETQISELKKENFGLKLRIYFLEERLKNDDTPEDIFKANVELKVTVEKLKKELVEKQELLVKASNAVEMIASHSEDQINQMREEHNEELHEIREGYENKVKEIEKELAESKQDVEDLAERLTETVNMNQQLNEKLLESTEGFHDNQRELQADTKETLNEKDKMIDDLNQAFDAQKKQNEELQRKAAELEKDRQKALDDLRKLVEGEKKMKQMVEELNKRNKAFEDMKDKARKLEKLNRELRNQLHDKERELHMNSRNSMDTSQAQSPGVKEKDASTKTKIEDLEQSLAAARESAHTAKMKWYQTFEEHQEVVKTRDANIAELQSTLGTKDLELERLTQLVSSSNVEAQRLNNGKLLLEQKLDETIKQKNQELADLANKLKALSQEYSEKADGLEEHCRKVISSAQEQVGNKDQIIKKMAANSNEKDKIIADFVDALKDVVNESTTESPLDVRDELLKKLQNHLREKDRAVEDALNDKFRCLEEKDGEVQQLRQALRDRDRLIEKINSAVVGSAEQVRLLEEACSEKDSLLQSLKRSSDEQEKAHKDALSDVAAALHEKEAVLHKLQTALDVKGKELADLKEFAKELTKTTAQNQPNESIRTKDLEEELKAKEKLLEDLLQERSRMSIAHEANTQRLMGALQDKDNLMKDAADTLIRMQTEKNATIQRLQQLLNGRDHEIQSLENSKAWANQEQELLLNKLRSALSDKDRTIQELIDSSKEKDQMLIKLQDSLRTPKKAPNTPDMDKMRRTIADLESSLKKKSESLRKLEADYQANMRNSQNQVENIENKMKIENLQHEVQSKDAMIKQAQETIGNLRGKLENLPIIEDLKQKFSEQSQAYLDAQKGKEKALMELALLKKEKLESNAELKAKHDNIDLLTQAAKVKDGVIREMQDTQKLQLQEMQENISYYQKKAHDHETANDALRHQLSENTSLNSSLQRQLEALRHNLLTKSPSRQDSEELAKLRAEVSALRAQLQRPSTPQRETTVGAGRDEQGVQQLHKALEDQVAETTKLNEILGREREMYINVIQHLRDSPGDPIQSAAVTRELQTLKALRAQLEEGIRQNNVLRAQLQNQVASQISRSPSSSPQSPYDAVYQREIQELKSRLEDSERWNASLQARLNELQPRAGGVGGSGVIECNDAADERISPEAMKTIQQQLNRLTSQLQQSTQLNARLNKDLAELRTASTRQIGEQDAVIENQTAQINNLQSQLSKTKETFSELECRLRDANGKLEYYARNVNVDFEDVLMEKEEEVDSLRTQLQDLKSREELLDARSGSDFVAQTSPGFLPGESPRQVEKLKQQLVETQRWNEQCKKLLDEKVKEIQMLKQKEALARRTDSPEKSREMAELQRLRQEYEKGVRTNDELKRQMEGELSAIARRENSLQSDVLNMADLRQKLDQSLRQNESLQERLRDSLRSGPDVNHVKKELNSANKVNESLALQIQDLQHSIERFGSISEEAERLRRDLKSANQLNSTLSEQLKETRHSAEETNQLNREVRQSKQMNEQLGKQLAELLDHLAKFKKQNERLRDELEQKKRAIEGLELRLTSRPSVQSRGASPIAPLSIITGPSPIHDYAATQTSPGLGLYPSPPSLTRVSSPRSGMAEQSPGVVEKMHKLNKTLMSENSFLRNKLKENERYNITLKEELEMYQRIRRESLHTQTSPTRSPGKSPGQSTDELLASYMNEMRALRLRLEESIRTNDALKAQLERKIAEGGGGGDAAVAVFESDKLLLYVRENDTLRAELLEKDKANERLRHSMEDLRKERDLSSSQVHILRTQVEESNKTMENLRKELSVYERLYKISSAGRGPDISGTSYVREGPRSPDGGSDSSAITLLLAEIRSLRVQLEKSIQTNNALRLKLEEQLNRPLSQSTQSSRTSPSAIARRLDFGGPGEEDRPGSPTGRLAAHVDREYFIELEAKIECICNETSNVYGNIHKGSQLLVEASVRNIQTWANDCKRLLGKFNIDDSIRGQMNTNAANENMNLRLEIAKLKKKLLSQEDIIKQACARLEDGNRMKEGIQTKIIDQLSESQAVLQKARGTLQDKSRSRRSR